MAGGRYLFLVHHEQHDWATPVLDATHSWRLIGANNRPIARGAHEFADLVGCLAAVQLIATLDLVDGLRLMVDVDTGRWNWRLHRGEDVLAVSARSYQRKRECVYSAQNFAAIAVAAAEAVAADSVSLVNLSRPGARGSVPAQGRILDRPVGRPVLG